MRDPRQKYYSNSQKTKQYFVQQYRTRCGVQLTCMDAKVGDWDGAYHQGTVWGWLIGPFVLAHLRVFNYPAQARSFLEPMANHLCAHGVGSLSEIFNGDEPFTPRGCIAQAWIATS